VIQHQCGVVLGELMARTRGKRVASLMSRVRGIWFLHVRSVCVYIKYWQSNAQSGRRTKGVTTMSEGKRRAIVIGGSISGLFAALLLQRHGWQVEVLERVRGELAGRGAGIVAQPELRVALAAAGIGDIGEVGVRVETRILLDAGGRELMSYPCPQTVTSWERVRGLLRGRWPDNAYRDGVEVLRIEQSAEGATIVLGSGERLDADLVVGADGIRSTVRQQYFPEVQPQYSGYVGWRSLIDERAFSKATHERIFWRFAFGLPPGEQFLGYPVTGPNDDLTPGNLRYNMIWYRPATEEEFKRLLTDVTGKVHAVSIPPPLIRNEIRAELIAAAERLLAPEYQECVRLSPQAFIQPIYDVLSSHVSAGRVAIIGDAAFVARPHVAAGVIKAAEDVLAMVKALDEESDVAAALARYESERVPIGRQFVARAQSMGANYSPRPAGSPAALSGYDAAYAKKVVEETALIDWLRQA
jgi:2-polyprenyl-6-methoxyphenol hydroxylase-like FAD-dependent oxidoreductase